MANLVGSWREVFALDRRALAMFRIGLGVVVLCDLGQRLPDLGRHYSDQGVWPRANVFWPQTFSLHMLFGDVAWQYLLFALAAGVAILLCLGVAARACAFALFLFMVSLHNRNEIILEGFDQYLRALLLWASFLPLADFYSLPRAGASRLLPPKERMATTTSLATAALLGQIFIVYFVNGWNKVNASWLSGRAIEYALQYWYFPTSLGQSLLGWPQLLRLGTYAVLALELIGPLLLFSPHRLHASRLAFVLLFSALHGAIWLTLDVGLFPMVSMVALLAIIPTSTLDAAYRYIARIRSRPEDPAWASLRSHRRSLRAWSARLHDTVLGAVMALVLLLPWVTPERAEVSAIGQEDRSLLADILAAFRLRQSWGMFRQVPSASYWPVVVAVTESGKRWRLPDFALLDKAPPLGPSPVEFARHRQKKEFLALGKAGRSLEHWRAAYARYICATSARGEADPLRHLLIYSVRAPAGSRVSLGPQDVVSKLDCAAAGKISSAGRAASSPTAER